MIWLDLFHSKAVCDLCIPSSRRVPLSIAEAPAAAAWNASCKGEDMNQAPVPHTSTNLMQVPAVENLARAEEKRNS